MAVRGALDPQRVIDPAAGERSAFVAEAEHSDGIASFVIEQERPLEWLAFARAMETLIGLRGADLLRVKGILNVAGCRGPVVVQYVQHLAHPPVELESGRIKTATAVPFSSRGILRNGTCELCSQQCRRWQGASCRRRKFHRDHVPMPRF